MPSRVDQSVGEIEQGGGLLRPGAIPSTNSLSAAQRLEFPHELKSDERAIGPADFRGTAINGRRLCSPPFGAAVSIFMVPVVPSDDLIPGGFWKPLLSP